MDFVSGVVRLGGSRPSRSGTIAQPPPGKVTCRWKWFGPHFFNSTWQVPSAPWRSCRRWRWSRARKIRPARDRRRCRLSWRGFCYSPTFPPFPPRCSEINGLRAAFIKVKLTMRFAPPRAVLGSPCSRPWPFPSRLPARALEGRRRTGQRAGRGGVHSRGLQRRPTSRGRVFSRPSLSFRGTPQWRCDRPRNIPSAPLRSRRKAAYVARNAWSMRSFRGPEIPWNPP